jgi:hypothetical protein
MTKNGILNGRYAVVHGQLYLTSSHPTNINTSQEWAPKENKSKAKAGILGSYLILFNIGGSGEGINNTEIIFSYS